MILDACTEIVEKALAETDLLITTGGVSVGDYDYLPAIYERLGAKVLFNKVAMRPGSVTTVAVLGDKLVVWTYRAIRLLALQVSNCSHDRQFLA